MNRDGDYRADGGVMWRNRDKIHERVTVPKFGTGGGQLGDGGQWEGFPNAGGRDGFQLGEVPHFVRNGVRNVDLSAGQEFVFGMSRGVSNTGGSGVNRGGQPPVVLNQRRPMNDAMEQAGIIQEPTAKKHVSRKKLIKMAKKLLTYKPYVNGRIAYLKNRRKLASNWTTKGIKNELMELNPLSNRIEKIRISMKKQFFCGWQARNLRKSLAQARFVKMTKKVPDEYLKMELRKEKEERS